MDFTSVEKNLGQLLIMGLSSTKLKKSEAKFLIENNIGGVVLFKRNINTESQIKKLCHEIKSVMKEAELPTPFIGIDMEGGRVHRLPKNKFKNFPSARDLSPLNHTQIKDMGKELGHYLMSMGINLNFVPCLDILTEAKNKLIGDRSFGDTAEKVIAAATSFITGLESTGIFFCGKHFPGHGNTTVDSHFDLPKDYTPWSLLQKRELLPYVKLSKRLPMIMTAHILQINLDDKKPITLSKKALPLLLRHCSYTGLVISDDLEMKAIAKYHPEKQVPAQALKSGCHLIMYCNDLEAPQRVLSYLKQDLKKGLLNKDVLREKIDKIWHIKAERL